MSKSKKIILTSPESHGGKDIGVNGVNRHIPYNKKVEVTEAEYEVLQNADLGTARITDQKDDEDTEADVRQVGAGDAKAGTEASPIQAPATPAEISTTANPLLNEKPTEELKGGDVQLRDDTAGSGDSQLTEKVADAKPAAKPGRKPAAKSAAK